MSQFLWSIIPHHNCGKFCKLVQEKRHKTILRWILVDLFFSREGQGCRQMVENLHGGGGWTVQFSVLLNPEDGGSILV